MSLQMYYFFAKDNACKVKAVARYRLFAKAPTPLPKGIGSLQPHLLCVFYNRTKLMTKEKTPPKTPLQYFS